MKAAVNLSRSYHEYQAAEVEFSAADRCSTSMSSDVIETGPVSTDSWSSNAPELASSEIDVISRCPEERTQDESAVVQAAGTVDVDDVDMLKSASESAADSDRKPKHSRGVGFRQRRSRSARCRRKEFINEDVGLRRRRGRSLERRQSSTDAKHAMTSPEGGDKSGEVSCGGTVRKSDSFDSGIDTKSESISPRTSGTDDVVDIAPNSRPEVAPLPSDASSTRDVTPEVLSVTAAEVEFDRKAATLVHRLGDDDDVELRQVLSSSTYRVPTCYMCGVFDDVVRPLSSNIDDADECSELCSSVTTDELKVGPLL